MSVNRQFVAGYNTYVDASLLEEYSDSAAITPTTTVTVLSVESVLFSVGAVSTAVGTATVGTGC
ncbi:hypothetical protein ACFWNH_30875 [Rhodococcus qingshengii]|uniref:hypothetical protein n=1 Tax=Rhodococcus qingshengii TaxID=334542 RepID=UPI00237CA91D|nr:hypothetical protein [Rhodococcus qingshengii]WCT06159.1 hypothetical protein PI247_31060 [Rhodococcus qingshengii]